MSTGLWKLLIFGIMGGVYAALILQRAARRSGFVRPLACVLLGWLVPGAGHMWLGRVRKGLFLFALIAGLFSAGVVLAGGRAVSFDENPFYNIGQVGSGLTLGVHEWLAADGVPPRNIPELPLVDPGLLYMAVAGLLNLLLILNLFDLMDAPPPLPSGSAPAAGRREQSG